MADDSVELLTAGVNTRTHKASQTTERHLGRHCSLSVGESSTTTLSREVQLMQTTKPLNEHATLKHSSDRPRKLTYINQRLLDVDGRFARDLDYLFVAQYIVEC